MNTRTARIHSAAGFTLVELMVVLAIIAMLAGVVMYNLAPNLLQGKQTTAQAQIQVLSTALQSYASQQGRLPTQDQGLQALIEKPTRPPVPPRFPEGGYLTSRELPLDPWGAPYLYLAPGRAGEPFEVISFGADGEEGGTGRCAAVAVH